jgi:Tol biopolymer transport system component
MDSDGTNQRRLASHVIVKATRGWSPDSKRIAFTAVADSNVDVYSVDVPSGQITRLTSSPGEDRDPSWSPTGARVVFSSTRDGAPQVYIIRADGRDAQRLTHSTSPAEAPRWSPDGRAMLFVSNRDLYAIRVDGQRIRQLTSGAHVTRDPPLWSPDGTRIAFQVADGENYDIGLVRVSDGVRSQLASTDAYDGSYTWSEDGKRVACVQAAMALMRSHRLRR